MTVSFKNSIAEARFTIGTLLRLLLTIRFLVYTIKSDNQPRRKSSMVTRMGVFLSLFRPVEVESLSHICQRTLVEYLRLRKQV